MKTKDLARWAVALGVVGAFVIGGAHLALPNALQQDEQGPGLFGPRVQGRTGFRGGPGGGFMYWRMLRQLNLTEEQKTQLQALRKAHFEKTEDKHGALMSAREQFDEAVRALEEGSGSEDAVYTASQALAEAQAALAVARAGFGAELMAVLTPEQQKKLEELRSEMETFRRQRFERRRQRPQDLQPDGPRPQRP